MKIVIPTNGNKGLTEKVSEHFGRCQTYTFLDENGKIVEIINNTSEHMGGQGLPPELMKANGAHILLCRGLGPRALTLCQQLGIAVYVNDSETVTEIFYNWKNNNLIQAGPESACKNHH